MKVKPIANYEVRYTVSDCGEVMSLNYAKSGFAHPLKPGRSSSGYLSVALRKGCGAARTFNVHRLVAEAFVANPNGLVMVNHINGDKSDNHAENLEWCTAQQNSDHAIATGIFNNRGERAKQSKLTDSKVSEMRARYSAGDASFKTIALEYGVDYRAAYNAIKGLTWRHVQ